MMLKDDYRKLFDSISPDAALEQRTGKEIIEMLNPKKRQRTSIRRTVCIAAAMLLIVGTAFAAVSASGILARLFPNGEPSQQAMESVVANAAQVSENGVTLNLDEYLVDQNTLHLGWTVSSQRETDVFYTTAYELIYSNAADEALANESIGGVYGPHSSSEIGNNMLAHLSKDAPAFSGFADYGYMGSLTAPVEAKVIIRAYETDHTVASVDSAMDLYYAEDPAVAALENAKQVGVDPEHRSSINGYTAFVAALDKLIAEGMDENSVEEAALIESGIFREIAVLEAAVTIEPGQTAVPRFCLNKEMRFELSDASIILKTLNLDTASTIVEYEVHTEKEFNASNAAANGVTYILFDQNGNPLNADYALSMSLQQLDDIDGKRAWKVALSGNPLPENMTAITFVPTAVLERNEGEASNAFFFRMAEQAVESQCFTVEID